MRGGVIVVLLLTSCALLKPAARTAVDIARSACDVFLSEQPEADRPYGMDLDTCVNTLLSAQQQKLAAARKQAP